MRTYKVRVPNPKYDFGLARFGVQSSEPRDSYVTIKAHDYVVGYGAVEFRTSDSNGRGFRCFAPGEWKEIEEVENG